MSKEDYLILMKGRAVCIVLYTAIGLLSEMSISIPEDFHLEMSYGDSMLDVVPGEEICN